MIRRVILFFLLTQIFIFTSKGQTPSINYVAFKPGEVLSYNIHYGLVNAASAILLVDKDYKSFNNNHIILFRR